MPSSSPFSLFSASITWTQIPDSLTATIGSNSAMGGAGILGYGNVAMVAAITGVSTSNPSPVPVGSVLAGGVTGVAYSATISAQGGTSPYTFAISSGALPTGLTMSSGGAISGTPSSAGSFTFTVTVTDSNSDTGSQSFTIAISAPVIGGGSYVFVA